MVQDAEDYASIDAEQRRRVGALNKLEEYVANVRRQLADPEGLGGQVCYISPLLRPRESV